MVLLPYQTNYKVTMTICMTCHMKKHQYIRTASTKIFNR